MKKKRGKAPKGKGNAKDAVKFAMNPTGFAAKKVAGAVAGEVAKRVSKAGGGMSNKKRAMYKHGGYATAMHVQKPN